MVQVRTRWVILFLGLMGLAVAPVAFTATPWKQALGGIVALCLAIWWVHLWWPLGDARRRLPRVAVLLGVTGGLVLGLLVVGLYCQVTDCAAGFDALVLVPGGALFGAFVGGGIGSVVAHRLERGSPFPPNKREKG